MRKLSLFSKLLLSSAAIYLGIAIVLALFFTARAEQRIVHRLDRQLRDIAYLLRGELDGASAGEQLQSKVRRLGEETSARITLLDGDGRVLADSAYASTQDVERVENHRDRPEISQARRLGQGTSSRPSATQAASYRYFALRVDGQDGVHGYVRSAIPLARVKAEAAAVRRQIWGALALATVAFVLLSTWNTARLLRPLTALTRGARAIVAGDYQQRVYVETSDEFAALGRILNQMGYELGTRTTQLGQTGDRQSTVLGAMVEGVIAVDHRQRVLLANSAAGRLFEFAPSSAEGRPLLEVVRNHSVSEAVLKTLKSRESGRLEIKRESPDRMRLEIHVQPLPGEPCPGVVLVMHDVTELRRLETLRRDFMANVSHELKTPLSSIKAYAETLRDGALHDAEASERFLARIEEQADRLHHLILDMLMLARIESDQQAFEIMALDLAEVVRLSLEHHRDMAEAKPIELSISHGNPPCRVLADREALRQILDNLIDNAIKYTPSGGRVTIDWDTEPSSGAMARITVRDTGIGIRPEDQRRVFERFFRVDKARSRELGGTGLGLAIVKHLAQACGGTVRVESQPKKGSTFIVELPLAPGDGAAPQSAAG